jgi:mono/diheme cytochrome c family protein
MPRSLGRSLLAAATAVALSTAPAACHRSLVPLPSLAGAAAAARDSAALVARGEYVVRSAAACGQCHATPGAELDGDAPLVGGRAFHDWRLGTVRASNLTPDSATGIGAWTDAEVVRALRNGEARDGRLLAPVMPYAWLHEMSDEDALAVARYLKSLAPARNEVRQQPSLTFRLARSLVLGPVGGATPVAAPPRGPTAEYGGYLARHVSLCADCHTARTGLQSAPDRRHLFAGDAHPPKEFPVNPANITPDSATGIGRWSEDDFVRTIRTGVDPTGHRLDTFMPWAEYRRMTDDDLRAIYRYLRTVPPVRRAVPRRAASATTPSHDR